MDALGFEKYIKFFEHTVNGIILSAICMHQIQICL